MAEWVRPSTAGRTIGVLRVNDDKLTFVEQVGQANWEVDLTAVRRVTTAPGGKALSIVLVTGEEYVVAVMAMDLTPAPQKKALAILERAVQSVAANNR